MAEAIRPGNILKSTVLDQPRTLTGGGKSKGPTIPGSGQGFRPDKQPAPRKSHKLAIGLGLTGVATVGGVGAYIGSQSGSESSTTNTAITTIVDVTQPPLTTPETTVITTTVPTTETPTTLPERVFASPEQQAQVEAVEANMSAFFELTPNDLEQYKSLATFNPYPDGFAPIKNYSDAPETRVLAINLGTFTSVGDSGQATIHMFGVMKEDGTRFVTAETLVVTDPEIAGEEFSYVTGTRKINLMNPIRDNVYGSTDASDIDTLLDHKISMPEAISLLNSNPGLPMGLDVAADSSWLTSFGLPTEVNPNLKLIFEEVFELGSGDHVQTVLDKYTIKQLEDVGIFKLFGQIPQEMLSYTSAGQLLSKYAWNGYFNLFNNIPNIPLA